MAVDFAKIGEGYGAKSFVVKTMDDLYAALKKAKKIKDRPVVLDIRVLPKSMTDGYGSWWRCGDVQVSEKPNQKEVYKDHLAHVKDARKY